MKKITDISLKTYNTFAIDCKAHNMLVLENEDDIVNFVHLKDKYSPFYILAGGSNVLFTSDFEGTILLIRNKGIRVIEENGDNITIEVSAGESWEEFVNYCVKNSYFGVENLAGIPGLVGSSPVQNIGAYGMEVKDTITAVDGYFIDSGKKSTFLHAACGFGYRSSIFKTELKNKFIITSVTFQLSKRESYNLSYTGLKEFIEKNNITPTLSSIQKAVISLRNSKLPDIRKIGSAGSFFKNPVISIEKANALKLQYPDLATFPIDDAYLKVAAGKLIDLAGWKGYRKGDVGVYPQQALVLVNYGNATGSEVVNLYQKIIDDIQLKFGIRLEPEVNIVFNNS